MKATFTAHRVPYLIKAGHITVLYYLLLRRIGCYHIYLHLRAHSSTLVIVLWGRLLQPLKQVHLHHRVLHVTCTYTCALLANCQQQCYTLLQGMRTGTYAYRHQLSAVSVDLHQLS